MSIIELLLSFDKQWDTSQILNDLIFYTDVFGDVLLFADPVEIIDLIECKCISWLPDAEMILSNYYKFNILHIYFIICILK